MAVEVRALVAAAVEQFGRLDIAFNNAGTEGAMKPIVELTEVEFDHAIGINLKGVWLSIKYEVEAMLAQGRGGVIVNTSSFLSRGAVAGSSVYSDRKSVVEGRSVSVRVDYGGCR